MAGSLSEQRVRQAAILVGGLGTRLGALTAATPKPLLPVAGRPFVVSLIDELQRQGIDKILLMAGFAGDQVIEMLGRRPGVTVVVEPAPLGTGGALAFAAPHLDEQFLLLNGDSLFDINVWDLVGRLGDGVAAMALRRVDDVSRYGAVSLEGDRVAAFTSAQAARPGIINGGVLACSRAILDWITPGGAVSLEQEVFPELARRGLLRGAVYDRPFLDIGIPADFARAQTWLDETLTRGAVVFDRDGVLNRDIGYAHRPDQIEWIEGAREAVKRVNDEGWFAFVATNQAGVARGLYTEDDVAALHQWMNEQLVAVGAHIDCFAHSPYHPEGTVERYRAVTECRKPGSGMITDLLGRFRVDRALATMIGDKPSDVEAARAAGIDGVLFGGGNLADTVADEIDRLRRRATPDYGRGAADPPGPPDRPTDRNTSVSRVR